MSDYSQYQGPSTEWEAFIQTAPQPPPDLDLPPQEIRKATNALRVRLSQNELGATDLYSRVSCRDYSILTRDNLDIIARVYCPSETTANTTLPVYLYFHGGGHLLGNIETDDFACFNLSYNSSSIVVNVNYRHTPEFKHPTQINDAWDSFLWLSSHISSLNGDPTQVFVGGISAGATLAASIVKRESELLCAGTSTSGLNIKGQLLCIPWLIHPYNPEHPFRQGSKSSSYEQNIKAPVLPLSLLSLFTDLLGVHDLEDEELNLALMREDKIRQLASRLPKTTFLIAGQDLLRDEGLFYAEKLGRNGVSTKVHVFPGLPHGFRRFCDLPSSRRWDELLGESLRWFVAPETDSCTSEVERPR